MNDVHARTVAAMGTLVTIQIVDHGEDSKRTAECDAGIDRAFDWFHHIEACCSRFEPASELMQLTAQIGIAVPVSALVFEAVQFAVAVAEESGGAFDPTVGHLMETRGFNREHRTGRLVESTDRRRWLRQLSRCSPRSRS